MVGVRVEGASRLRRTLRDAGDDLTDLKDAHRAAALIAARAAVRFVPWRTGRLAGSIGWRGTASAGTIRAGTRSRVPYAGPIHWGWPKRGIEPQPFLTDGAQASEPTWLPVFEKTIDKAISKVKGI